ncbi:type II secretion system protein [Vibrio lamellibrachiae]|uniref:type II secretion system protein n=1 Tax=Vibrio lamellibrachiae TaxID=2910253 RepID=UPI003D0F55B6
MDRRRVIRGFTLIELVVSIVIIGILAVVAAPRFLNLKSDAVASTVLGVGGALKSALDLANARIEIDNADTSIDYSGQTISLTERMPAASAGTLRALLQITVPESWTRDWETIPCDEPEFCILGNMFVGKSGYVEVPGYPLGSNGGLDRASYIWPKGYTLNSNGCYAFYINEASKEVNHSGSIVLGC